MSKSNIRAEKTTGNMITYVNSKMEKVWDNYHRLYRTRPARFTVADVAKIVKDLEKRNVPMDDAEWVIGGVGTVRVVWAQKPRKTPVHWSVK